MAKKIIWTPSAQEWLQDIFDFISLDNEAAAVKTVQGIKDKADLLLITPNIGYRHERDELLDDVMIILYGHYRIAYFISDNEDIFILGVFHGSLDIRKHLSRYE